MSAQLPQFQSEEIRQQFRMEQMRLMAVQGKRSISILLPAAIIILITWRYNSVYSLAIWLVALAIAVCTRIIFSRKILPLLSIENCEKYLRQYTFIMLYFGIAASLPSFLFLSHLPLLEGLLLCMIMTSVFLTGASIASYSKCVFFAYSIPAIGSLFLGSILADRTELYWAVSILPVLFFLQNMQVNSNIARTREIFFTKYENLDLVRSLEAEKKIAYDALQRAESANLAKSRFLAAASHDLRQPLHAVSLYIAVLKARMQAVHSYQNDIVSVVNNIEHSLTNASSLLNTLLDISRLDAGVVKTEIKIIPLQAIFQGISTKFQMRAAQKKLALTIEPTHLSVVSDAELLERILHNLVDNALKYTQAGTVKVYARALPFTVQITVEDTGSGIPESARQQIFQEFYQVENAERNQEKGLGLGLAIVRRTAELLNVKLSVQSTVNQGSRFTLTMQAVDQARQTPTTFIDSTKSEVEAKFLANKKIVFIEDADNVRQAMDALLITWGADVCSKEGPQEAINYCVESEWVPELIITDMRLRGALNGLDVIEQLRQHFGAIPALLITGETSPEQIALAQNQQVDVLYKPVNPITLQNHLIQRLAIKSVPVVIH